MKKFKVGDKVVRVSETYGKAIKGEAYEVSEVSDNEWAGSCGINLKGHAVEGTGKFNYESSSFDLYDDNILSPLEAADAILHKEPLQEFCENTGKWFDFACSLKGITLYMLQNTKFRHKPKTVFINGVEVVAPVDIFSSEDTLFGLNMANSKSYIILGKDAHPKAYYWATEEDAQNALDAMLLPFKENNND